MKRIRHQQQSVLRSTVTYGDNEICDYPEPVVRLRKLTNADEKKSLNLRENDVEAIKTTIFSVKNKIQSIVPSLNTNNVIFEL